MQRKKASISPRPNLQGVIGVTYSDRQISFTSCRDALPIAGWRGNVYCAPHIRIETLNALRDAILGPRCEGTMELRKDVRYRLDAPAVFSWEGARHKCFQGEGITRDISVQGAFILTATVPPPDCPVHVDLLLPSVTGVMTTMRITGKARVIRLERSSKETWIRGFAVVTDELNQWDLLAIEDQPEMALAEAGRAH